MTQQKYVTSKIFSINQRIMAKMASAETLSQCGENEKRNEES